MRHGRRRRGLVGLVVLVALVGSAFGVAAVFGSDSDNSVAQDAAKNYAATQGAHRVVRAFGVDPAAAKPALESAGQTVSVAESDKVACLLREDGNDYCFSKANIATGLGFTITNDCSAGGDRSMLVRGFAPEGAASVAVAYSDGTTPLKADLARGAYFLTATTPAKGEPYPSEIRYLSSGGKTVRSEPIRDGDNLCLDQR
jgi:hypothetical protein